MYQAYPQTYLNLAPGYCGPTTQAFRGSTLGELTNVQAWAESRDTVLVTWDYAWHWEGQDRTVQVLVYLNGAFYASVHTEQISIGSMGLSQKNRIDLTVAPTFSTDAPWLFTGTGSRVTITWDASTETNLEEYRVYYDNGSGTVSYTSPLISTTNTTATTEELSGVTHKFVIRTYDSCGNESDNTDPAITETLRPLPLPLADLAMTFDDNTQKITATWTPGSGTVNVYSNNGEAIELAPDFFFKLDSVASSTGTWTSDVLADGTWRVAAWSQNQNGEDRSGQIFEFLVVGGIEQISPNKPISLVARTVAGGAVEVFVTTDTTPTSVRIYGDSRSGTIDYGTMLASVALPTASEADSKLFGQATITQVTLGAGDGIYTLGARAVVGGIVETNTDVIVQVQSCIRLPDAPTGVGGEPAW